jgi:hypothetical protein
MMSFTPTTYSTASNAPSSAAGSPSPSRLIFNACGFGVVAWGDRARGATADLVGDSGPPVPPNGSPEVKILNSQTLTLL